MKCLFIWLFLIIGHVACDCYDYNDCVTCTNHLSWSGSVCRWCPLDEHCHAYGSLKNACKRDMNVKDTSNCYHEIGESFRPDNAYVGTLLSAAAYSKDPEQCLKQILPNMDFQMVHAIGMRCDDFLFDYGECFAYTAISHTSQTIILSYRGTTSVKQLIDQILTVIVIPKQSFFAGGNVQKYFINAHNKLYSCIRSSLIELVTEFPDYHITITGHSLGGAIASLSAAALIKENVISSNKMYLYTFGIPRVGNKRYAFEHDKLVKNSWRIVHYKDIVNHLSTCNLITKCSVTNGPYHHGKEIYYGVKDMTVQSSFKYCRGNEDTSCSNGASCKIAFFTCIKYHKNYYGIDVGNYCKNVGVSGQLLAKTNLPNDRCQRRNYTYSRNKTSTDYGIDQDFTDIWTFVINIGIPLVVITCFICFCFNIYRKCCKSDDGDNDVNDGL